MKLTTILAAALLLAPGLVKADPILVTGADLIGSRSITNSDEIVGGGAWALPSGFTINWNIALSAGLWHYTYDLTIPTGAVSHLILEVSESFTTANLKNLTGSTIEKDDPNTYSPGKSGNSNPGLPDDIFGMKLTSGAAISFDSDRAPIWGDFYSKDGEAGGLGQNFAYNTNFGTDPLTTTTDFSGWIPTPDTVSVTQRNVSTPEPSSMALFGSVLLGVGFLIRRKIRKA